MVGVVISLQPLLCRCRYRTPSSFFVSKELQRFSYVYGDLSLFFKNILQTQSAHVDVASRSASCASCSRQRFNFGTCRNKKSHYAVYVIVLCSSIQLYCFAIRATFYDTSFERWIDMCDYHCPPQIKQAPGEKIFVRI